MSTTTHRREEKDRLTAGTSGGIYWFDQYALSRSLLADAVTLVVCYQELPRSQLGRVCAKGHRYRRVGLVPQRRYDLGTSSATLALISHTGSDTVGITLTYITYVLSSNPTIAANLRAELASNVEEEDKYGVDLLRSLPYLNALIRVCLHRLSLLPQKTELNRIFRMSCAYTGPPTRFLSALRRPLAQCWLVITFQAVQQVLSSENRGSLLLTVAIAYTVCRISGV